MAWVNPFGEELIPVANQSAAEYSLVANQTLQLYWSTQQTGDAIATNNILIGEAAIAVKLPQIKFGANGFACFIYNGTAGNIAVQTFTGQLVYNLPQGGVIEVILTNSFATSEIAGWRFIPMNVGNLTVTDPSSVSSDTVGVNSLGRLYTKQKMYYINVADLPPPISVTYTYPITELTGNDVYIANLTPCIFELPSATINDVGKNIAFKNMTDGVVQIKPNSASGYYIDFNLATNIQGFDIVYVSPGETITLVYGGSVNNNSNVYNMYYLISKSTDNNALLTEVTVPLPPAPAPNPVTLDVNTVASDVIYFTDSDQSNPANGSYVYFVPYPIPKVYYIAINTVLQSVGVQIKFQDLNDPRKAMSLNANNGMTLIFVDVNGYVSVAFPVINVAFATTAETLGGQVNNKAVSPFTLKEYFDAKSATQAEVNAGVLTDKYVSPATFNSLFVETLRGIIVAWPKATPPAGALICNGQTIPPATFPIAIAKLGITTVPDLRGVFLRGLDNGRGIDPGRILGSFQNSQNLQHSHVQGGSAVGGSHMHPVNDPGHSHVLQQGGPEFGTTLSCLLENGSGGGNITGGTRGLSSITVASQVTGVTVQPSGDLSIPLSGNTADSGGSESRPQNVALNYIILLFN